MSAARKSECGLLAEQEEAEGDDANSDHRHEEVGEEDDGVKAEDDREAGTHGDENAEVLSEDGGEDEAHGETPAWASRSCGLLLPFPFLS